MDSYPLAAQQPEPGASTLSRRSFLRGVAATVGAGVLASSLLGRTAEALAPYDTDTVEALPSSGVAADVSQLDRETRQATTSQLNANPQQPQISASPVRPSAISPKVEAEPATDGYGDTLVKTGMMFGGNVAMAKVGKSLGLPIGHAALMPKKVRDSDRNDEVMSVHRRLRHTSDLDIAKLTAGTGIAIPILEEMVFRLGPSVIADKLVGAKGSAWTIGALTTGVFASMHAYDARQNRWSLPLPQVGLGALTWWMQRNRGFSHAALAHIGNNVPAAAILGVSIRRLRDDPGRFLTNQHLTSDSEPELDSYTPRENVSWPGAPVPDSSPGRYTIEWPEPRPPSTTRESDRLGAPKPDWLD